MPVCIKCGGEIAEGAQFCPDCGARVVVPKPPKVRDAPEIGLGEGTFGAPDWLALIGALALLVGPFLSWLDVLGFPAQGLDSNDGIILYVMGALCLVAVIMARNLGRISAMVYVGLALCALAIVGHFVYQIYDSELIEWGDMGIGFYIAGAGAVLVLVGGISRLLMKTE
jgi:hypothetical protein